MFARHHVETSLIVKITMTTMPNAAHATLPMYGALSLHLYSCTLVWKRCRDEVLYVHLNFYIIPTLFAYFWHAIPTSFHVINVFKVFLLTKQFWSEGLQVNCQEFVRSWQVLLGHVRFVSMSQLSYSKCLATPPKHLSLPSSLTLLMLTVSGCQ